MAALLIALEEEVGEDFGEKREGGKEGQEEEKAEGLKGWEEEELERE